MNGTLAAHSVWSIDRIKDYVSKIGSGVTPSGGTALCLDVGVPGKMFCHGREALENWKFFGVGRLDIISAKKKRYEGVTLAQFNLDWFTEGRDWRTFSIDE
jgi:hypothetical protein